MYKKKDKFKTTGREMKLKNIVINDLDDIYYYESSKDTKTKSSRKAIKKDEQSLKTGIKLHKCRVIEVNSNYSYKINYNDEIMDCVLSGRLKYLDHEYRNPVCIGDFVNIDITDINNLRIEEIYKRKNFISRFIEKKHVLLAANIDQVVIVVSVNEPTFNANLIDRYITIAEICNITPIICINKIDLEKDIKNIKKECEYYENMEYKVVYTSTKNRTGIDELEKLLHNKDSLFTGHSGTGKSSLINALEPNINLKTADISSFNNKGTHTTTNSRMIKWAFGGHLMDSPGIKTLGLHKNDLNVIPFCFPGFKLYYEKCEFSNCTHTHEENCSVKQSINITIPQERYDSYLSIRGNL